MKYYLAPMESITGYVYRRALLASFPAFDKYVTPFLAPKQDKTLNARERRDVLPENNEGMRVVPQILTNRAEDFIRTAEELKEMGYRQVNLNLGCPSATVVTKNKGAGLLKEKERLERLLEEIFERTDMEISVKTRLGMWEAEEFYELLDIYNKYPLSELVVHARVREDYYKNRPNLKMFGEALRLSSCPVIYNGDVFSEGDAEKLRKAFPGLEGMMLGRGVIANPALLRQLQGGEKLTVPELKAFLERLITGYSEIYSGEKDVLFRLKELWFYLAWSFPDSEKWMKGIRKAQRLSDYREAAARLFAECRLCV